MAFVLPAAASAADSFREAMLRELNRIRAHQGLPSVRGDARMDGGARTHSRRMAARGYVAHGRWTGRVAAASRRAHSVGEVLGWLAPSDPRGEAAWLVRAWLGSPSHRPVVLGASFRRVGIGRTTGWVGGQSAAIYTVDFATAR
jgi:uncharacterized protein YkwD